MTKQKTKKIVANESKKDLIKWLAISSVVMVGLDFLLGGFLLRFAGFALGLLALINIRKYGFEEYKTLAMIGFFIGFINSFLVVVAFVNVAQEIF